MTPPSERSTRDARSASWRVWLLLAVAGCTRYEYRVSCPPAETPAATSAVAWETSADERGAVVGRVVAVGGTRPLPVALVTVSGPGTDGVRRQRPPAQDGTFRFDSLPPGRYTLSVHRIGYDAGRAVVRLSADSGAVVVVAMALQHLVLDGCGHVLTRQRKPWWKWW